MCPALPHRNAASHRGISVFRNGWEPVRPRLKKRVPPIAPGRERPRFSPPGSQRSREVPAPVPFPGTRPDNARLPAGYCRAERRPYARGEKANRFLTSWTRGPAPYRAERLPVPASHPAGLNPAPSPPTLRGTPPRPAPTIPRVTIRRPRAHRDAHPACPPRRSVMGVTFSLNDEERHWLSRLARQSITTALEGREDGPPPLPPALIR